MQFYQRLQRLSTNSPTGLRHTDLKSNKSFILRKTMGLQLCMQVRLNRNNQTNLVTLTLGASAVLEDKFTIVS